MDSLFYAMHDPAYLLVLAFVCFGLVCVFVTFGFMIPFWIHFLTGLWSAVMQEQVLARFRGKQSGVELPDDHPAKNAAA
jgi:uncharacterized membrane protein YesL